MNWDYSQTTNASRNFKHPLKKPYNILLTMNIKFFGHFNQISKDIKLSINLGILLTNYTNLSSLAPFQPTIFYTGTFSFCYD